MAEEPLDLVVIRSKDGHRFDRRRVLADPEPTAYAHRVLIAHLRAIARAEERRHTKDDWLSEYELDVFKAGKDQPLFRITALGREEI